MHQRLAQFDQTCCDTSRSQLRPSSPATLSNSPIARRSSCNTPTIQRGGARTCMTMRDKGYHDERSAVVSSPRPTRHQQEILELASIGLSYDEIAARLSVSSRTIRFQFEKIFRVLGVRSRSEAVAIWMDSKRQARRPVDECPYPKPFPD